MPRTAGTGHALSNTGGTIQYNFPTAQDSHNLKGERGRSDFDIGHSFAGAVIWSPHFSRAMALRDWQLSGTSTIYTGPPFTPKVANFNYTNGEASRPDRVAKGTLNPGACREIVLVLARDVPISGLNPKVLIV